MKKEEEVIEYYFTLFTSSKFLKMPTEKKRKFFYEKIMSLIEEIDFINKINI